MHVSDRGGSLSGLTVLELGAGNGLCSFVAAHLGCKVAHATDISAHALELIAAAADDQGLNPAVSFKSSIKLAFYLIACEGASFDIRYLLFVAVAKC